MDNQSITTEQNRTDYQNAHISLLYVQAQGLNVVLEGIAEVLKNPNDLTGEQFNYWHNYGMQIADKIGEITETGKLLIDCARVDTKVSELQSKIELLRKAENAWLN